MINLFFNFYREENPIRAKEIDLCVGRNLSNPHLNIIMINSQKRITYNDFFQIINNYSETTDVNIISNCDIYFDNSIQIVNEMKDDEAFALSRWSMNKSNNIIFDNRIDSQDAWIFKGKIRNIYGNFCLGYLGCDNRIAFEIDKAGYILSNPSKSIKIVHVHSSNIRNYFLDNKNKHKNLVPPPYKTVEPILWEQRHV